MTPDTLALKSVTAEMIKGLGGVEAAAGFCRVGKSALSDNQSVNKPDSFVALDVVASLEPLTRERSGWPHVTQELCRRMGGVFVAVSEPDTCRNPDQLATMLARLSSEMNDTTGAVCRSLGDGRLSSDERVAIEAELDDVIRVAVEMRAIVRAGRGQ